MPRQLQGSAGPIRKMTAVAPIEKGGTGKTTPSEAVQALNGIERSVIGVPGGLVRADAHGRLPIRILTDSGFSVGYMVEGPDVLVHSQTSTFYLTNYNAQTPIDVSVDVGSVVQVNDEIRVTAPADGTTLTLRVGDRLLVLPVVPFVPVKPEIAYPGMAEEVQAKITAYANPFKSVVDLYSSWVTIAVENGVTASIPEGAVAVECEGRRGSSGTASIELGMTVYSCGQSVTRRRLERTVESIAIFTINGTGSLKYRWVYPSATHVSTDWELASDPDFTNILQSSYGDSVNLLTWPLELPLGDYYIRSRFNGRPIEA